MDSCRQFEQFIQSNRYEFTEAFNLTHNFLFYNFRMKTAHYPQIVLIFFLYNRLACSGNIIREIKL